MAHAEENLTVKLERGKICILLKFKLEHWETQESRLIYSALLMWVIQKLFSKGLRHTYECLACPDGNREEHASQLLTCVLLHTEATKASTQSRG